MTRPGYLLDTDPTTIDAVCFDGLMTKGESSSQREIRPLPGNGWTRRSRWRGPPLAEFGRRVRSDEIRRLEEHHLLAQEQLLETELALGRHAEAVPELETLIREHPLQENLRRLLMLALYRSGRQADALAAYRDTRTTLLDQLGLATDPSESLQALETAILNHDPALEPTALVVDDRQAVRRTNLPIPATAFIGRERSRRGYGASASSRRPARDADRARRQWQDAAVAAGGCCRRRRLRPRRLVGPSRLAHRSRARRDGGRSGAGIEGHTVGDGRRPASPARIGQLRASTRRSRSRRRDDRILPACNGSRHEP